MHVVLHGLAGSFGRSLEQRAHVHVEATVGIARSHDFRTTVVPVLTHLGYHDTRLTTLFLGKLLAQLASLGEVCIILAF